MSEPIPVYCISGLGADERVFQHLSLPGCVVYYLTWLKPEAGESMSVYAGRMAQQIRHQSPVLAGLSFGGMMAIEIARQVPVRKLVLFSSVKHRGELPLWMRLAGVLRLHKLVRLKPYKWLGPLENRNLGVESAEELRLVASFREQVDLVYLNWAIDQVLCWKNAEVPENVLHIHGSNDHIFPSRYIQADYVLPGAGHMLVFNRAHEVSEILQMELGTMLAN